MQSLTVMGGRNKYGEPEELDLELKAGDVLCIVGPTGRARAASSPTSNAWRKAIRSPAAACS